MKNKNSYKIKIKLNKNLFKKKKIFFKTFLI